MLDLEQRLVDAEATIQALLSGQIDAVVDATGGTPVLLANAQAALQQSEARYRYILETTTEGVWLIDAEHKTTFMNRRMAQMLGCEADMGLGRSPFEFLDQAGRAALASRLEQRRAYQAEVRYARADGGSFWALKDATPVFDSTGVCEGWLALFRDVTEPKLAAEALAELTRRTDGASESSPPPCRTSATSPTSTTATGASCSSINRCSIYGASRSRTPLERPFWISGFRVM